MNGLTTCSGQGVMIQWELKEEECGSWGYQVKSSHSYQNPLHLYSHCYICYHLNQLHHYLHPHPTTAYTPTPTPPTPPQQEIPSRCDPALNVSGWYSNAWRPSNAGQSDNKWCSTGHHHQPPINFIENGWTFQTCMLSRWCILYYHMDYSNLT